MTSDQDALAEAIARQIEGAYADWLHLGTSPGPFPPNSLGWFVERAYADAARIARAAVAHRGAGG